MKTVSMLLACLILGLQCTVQVSAQRGRGLIAFASNRHLNADRQAIYQIFVMDPNGENRVRLTNDPSRADNPAWSPNGRKIAFTSARHGKDDIYLINVNTDVRGKVRKVTIIVEPPNAEAQVQDVAAALDDGLQRLTDNPAHDDSPTWSADGKQVAFMSRRDGNREIYIMEADGRNQRNLTNHPAQDRDPAFSPNGKQIAFRSNRDGNYEIYLMTSEGRNVSRITENPAQDARPRWSPDGKKLAYTNNEQRNSEIYVLELETGERQNITNDERPDASPTWSPDGKLIAFTRSEANTVDIYIATERDNWETVNIINDELHHAQPLDIEPDWWDPAFPRVVSPTGEMVVLTWGAIKLENTFQGR